MSDEPMRVTVSPGLPGHPGENSDHEYPSTTTDIVKLLREAGADVEYEVPREERELVSLKAAILVFPILTVVYGAVGTLLANAMERLLGREEAARSNLQVRVVRGRGEDPDVFEGSSRGSDVLAALRQFDEGRDA